VSVGFITRGSKILDLLGEVYCRCGRYQNFAPDAILKKKRKVILELWGYFMKKMINGSN